MSQLKKRILISCGGTGGHIFPAIAIARALQKKIDAEFLFVGAQGKMEMEKVPAEGFSIVGLPIAGFQRSLTFGNIIKNLMLPFKLVFSFIKTFFVILRYKPAVAIGTGGYASGPTLKMANWMGIPTFIQEQNSLPGYTNRILGTQAKAVFVSFDGMEKYFANKNVINAGNAIREDFQEGMMSRSEALSVFGFQEGKKTIFITGGSLGANAINKAIEKDLEFLKEKNYQIIWQCGKVYLSLYKKYESESIKVVDFIQNIQAAYAAADIIVSRSGGAIFEMFVVGKPLIILPSPNVAEDHQTKNAMALEENNAAWMIKDIDALEKLVPSMIQLMEDAEKQEAMKQSLRKLAKPHAASEIADYIIKTVPEWN